MTKLNLSNKKNFPVLSPVIIDILNVSETSDPKPEDISKILYKDVSLYSYLLEFVDSTVFSLRSKVTTLDQAIKNFGLYRFRELVLLSSARKILTEPELLYRSVFVATCAKKISERLKSSAKDASEIFITALLMDLGSLFFFQKDNLFYRHIFDEESRLVRLLKEKERYGIDSHSLTTKILSSCQLPLEIEKILEDHKPEIHYSRFQLANAILDLAYRLAFMYQCEESEIQDLLCIDHFEKFELYKCEIDKDFVHKIHLEVQEVTSL